MELEKALNITEEKIKAFNKSGVFKTLSTVKHVYLIVLNEQVPKDLMTQSDIRKRGYEYYGRGGWVNNQLYIDSRSSGHRDNTKYGFYWAIDLDPNPQKIMETGIEPAKLPGDVKKQVRKNKKFGLLYLTARSKEDYNIISNNLDRILREIVKNEL